MSLEEQLKQWKNNGKTAIEAMKMLRDNNTPIPWVTIKAIWNKLEEQK